MRAVLVLALAALMPSVILGQQRWERQVGERIQRASATLARAPGLPVTNRVGVLNTDEAASFRATLIRGTRYAIIAVCDDDCVRLQLTLLKPSGSEIAKERNSESLPIIHFMADTTMAYGVRVMMEGCRWNPCWYAVSVIPLRKNPS
jgi:hypothetical protein